MISKPAAPKTPLALERERFSKQIARLRDCILNRTFELTLDGARRRLSALFILFLLAGFVIGFSTHPLSEWTTRIRNIFLYLFNYTAALTFKTNPIIDLITFAFGTWSNLLRYLAIFALPYMIAVHEAAVYLADIFEKPVSTARSFIGQVALGGSGETVTIREGEFVETDSRIYAIGGPGYVTVERDSVALFEKPDGRPHVIGPTVDEPVLLDGFERFRSAIDLRDLHIALNEPKNRKIEGRSLDGIPVSAIDVSFRFGIWRGGKERTLKEPNPYGNDSIVEDLIYNQALKVSNEAKVKESERRDIPADLDERMKGMVRRELATFISEHRLTEFLASYGLPEIKESQARNTEILNQTQKILPPGEKQPNLPAPGEPPSFTHRPDITARFREDFLKKANRDGLQLDWIDIGTWETPAEFKKVSEEHLDAWQLSIENMSRGNKEAIETVEKDAILQRVIELVQDVLLFNRPENQSAPRLRDADPAKRLLVAYYTQINEERELLIKNKSGSKAFIAEIDSVITYIKVLLGWEGLHFMGHNGNGDDPNQPVG